MISEVKVKQLNEERYGTFAEAAELSQQLKHIIMSGRSWGMLSPAKKEALDEIANRMSRVINGHPDEQRPWTEIRNYAELVLETNNV